MVGKFHPFASAGDGVCQGSTATARTFGMVSKTAMEIVPVPKIAIQGTPGPLLLYFLHKPSDVMQ